MQQARKDVPKGGKLRGHPRDPPEVQLSKTLSWLLRHGAKSQGLPMRDDGYVRVKDLVSLASKAGWGTRD
jgi:RNA:NAD 2'-phosphotransferase (TPT1/KptA family)